MKSPLPKPESLHWREFEHLCLVVFAHYFEATDASFYCGPGVGQRGIDIRLTRHEPPTPELVVV